MQKYSVLRWKIISTTLTFSIVPLLALGAFIYWQFSNAYTEKVRTNLYNTVENKKKAIDLFLDEKIAFIKALAGSHSIDDLSDQKKLNELFGVVQASSKSYIDLGVIDQDGNHLAYAGPYRIRDANYRDEPWFHEVMLKGQYLSDVFLGFRNYPHIIIAVLRREGDRHWILRATIDLEVLNTLVQSVQVGKQGDAYLMNKDMVLQTMSRFFGPPLTTLEMTQIKPFFGTRVETELEEGRERLAGMTWLDAINWMLVISEDPKEEMSPLLNTNTNLFILSLACSCLIVIGTLIVTQALIRKIMAADLETARLDASLVQSSKMASLGKLAAGVAHEVNNPLTLIRESAGWIKDLLTEEDPSKIVNYDEMVEVLGKIDQHVERAKGITHRMLGFGRRMDPTHENVSLNMLVEQTLKFLENEAFHRNITIEKDFTAQLPTIDTDYSQMQQVVLNIIENAIDAVADNTGVVRVRTGTTPSRDAVFVAVVDNGIGIPKDKIDKIFDPFFTTKKVGEGTGLGLSIVYGIIEKLGGHIEAASEEGKGTTFTVTLPL